MPETSGGRSPEKEKVMVFIASTFIKGFSCVATIGQKTGTFCSSRRSLLTTDGTHPVGEI
ncbi:hypothetical protein ES703_20626 [subsurface metagenome]